MVIGQKVSPIIPGICSFFGYVPAVTGDANLFAFLHPNFVLSVIGGRWTSYINMAGFLPF